MQKSVPLAWQRPNATEAYAADLLDHVSGYVPFPWATWIDRLRHGAALDTPLAGRVATGIRATVCQHIWALEHLELFQWAGITYLFWSHATQELMQIDLCDFID